MGYKIVSMYRLLVVTAGLLSLMAIEVLPFTLTAPAQANWSSEVDQTLAWRRSRPFGRRGDGNCLISPVSEENRSASLIWSERPVIVWSQSNQGAEPSSPVEWIEIRSARGSQVIERLTPTEGTSTGSLDQVAVEAALQPGETYQMVFKVRDLDTFQPELFQIMTAAERAATSADLQALVAGGGTAEEIALRQANYFADRQLWADYWQTLLSVEQPSDALKATIETERKAICEPLEAANS